MLAFSADCTAPCSRATLTPGWGCWRHAGRAEAVPLCVCCSLFVYVVCQSTLKGHEGLPEPSLYMGHREHPHCLLPVTDSQPVSPPSNRSCHRAFCVMSSAEIDLLHFTIKCWEETLSSENQPVCDVTKGLNDTSPRTVTFNSVQTA